MGKCKDRAMILMEINKWYLQGRRIDKCVQLILRAIRRPTSLNINVIIYYCISEANVSVIW